MATPSTALKTLAKLGPVLRAMKSPVVPIAGMLAILALLAILTASTYQLKLTSPFGELEVKPAEVAAPKP